MLDLRTLVMRHDNFIRKLVRPLTNFSSLFTTTQDTVIDSVSVTSGQTAERTLVKSNAGYYPIGIVGWTSHNRYPTVYGCRLSAQSVGSASIFCGVANWSGATRTMTVEVVVLWVKASLF